MLLPKAARTSFWTRKVSSLVQRLEVMPPSALRPYLAEMRESSLAVWAMERGIDTLVWSRQNAEGLTFEDHIFDAYTIAFGIRNVTHIDKALAEAHRVLKPGGVLVFKCQDVIHNHKMHATHVNVCNWAEYEGFRLLDLFVLPAKSRMPGPQKGTQRHARVFHSYFLVFVKPGKLSSDNADENPTL